MSSALQYDLTGLRFERLLVLDRQGGFWRCICNCGNVKLVLGSDLRAGKVRSCRCLAKEQLSLRAKKHGLCKGHMRAYHAWNDAISRCTQPDSKYFPGYGGRGIKVCKRWLNNFPAFLKDMGDPPKGKTLDRKNNNKGYSKGNCRWVTQRENINNRRNTRFLVYKGERKPLCVWAELFNVSRSALAGRLTRGWPVEQALTVASNGYSPR